MISIHQLALSLGLGLAASVLLALGLLMMKQRAAVLPIARGRSTLAAIAAWIRDPVWIAAVAVQTAGYALYIVALSKAPVSVMAVAMQGGVALFVVLAVTLLGERARIGEWIGIGAVVLAAAMLALSLEGDSARGALDGRALFESSIAIIAIAASLLGAPSVRETGVATAIVSGIAFGMGNLYAKALADVLAQAPDGTAVIEAMLTSRYSYLTVAGNVAGLVMLQNAFGIARGIVAMPLASAFSNLLQIVGGIAAFGERLPTHHVDAAMRMGAFALTILSAAALAAGDIGSRAGQAIVPAARSDSISRSA